MSNFISWNDFRKFKSVVRYERRYVRTPQTERFLEAVRRTAEGRISVIQKGWNRIWRAQRGSCEQEVKQDDETFYEDIAYPPERMKPVWGVKAGSIRRVFLASMALPRGRRLWPKFAHGWANLFP